MCDGVSVCECVSVCLCVRGYKRVEVCEGLSVCVLKFRRFSHFRRKCDPFSIFFAASSGLIAW